MEKLNINYEIETREEQGRERQYHLVTINKEQFRCNYYNHTKTEAVNLAKKLYRKLLIKS